jgi:hypothetical protein
MGFSPLSEKAILSETKTREIGHGAERVNDRTKSYMMPVGTNTREIPGDER